MQPKICCFLQRKTCIILNHKRSLEINGFKEQNNDASIRAIRKLIKAKNLFQQKGGPGDLAELHTMLHHKQQFLIQNDLLYRKIKAQFRDQPSLQFVLPTSLRQHAMLACHNDVGYLGLDRFLDLLKRLVLLAKHGPGNGNTH